MYKNKNILPWASNKPLYLGMYVLYLYNNYQLT